MTNQILCKAAISIPVSAETSHACAIISYREQESYIEWRINLNLAVSQLSNEINTNIYIINVMINQILCKAAIKVLQNFVDQP